MSGALAFAKIRPPPCSTLRSKGLLISKLSAGSPTIVIACAEIKFWNIAVVSIWAEDSIKLAGLPVTV